MKEKLITFWENSHFILFFAIFGVALMSWQVWRKTEIYKVSLKISTNSFKTEPSNSVPRENEIASRFNSQFEENRYSLIKNLIIKNNLFKEDRANGIDIETLAEKTIHEIEIDKVNIDSNFTTSFDLSMISSSRENAEVLIQSLAEQLSQNQISASESEKITILSFCCQRTEIVAPRRFLMITFGLFAGLIVGILFTFGQIKYQQLNHL